MRIMMITHSYYVRDPRVRREAEALVEAGHQLDVICLRDQGEPWRLRVNDVRIYHLPVRRRRGGALRYIFEYSSFFLLAFLFVSALHLRRRYHIVHVHNMPDFLVFCAFVPKLLGAKILLDVHDPMPELFNSIFNLPDQHCIVWLLRWQERLSYRFPDALLTVHEPMRQRLISCGVPSKRVHVLLNLPDAALFPIIAKTEPFAGTYTIVYTGTISPRYGLDLAVRALHNLQEEMSDVHLHIVGEGPDIPRLQHLAAILNVESKVHFAGVVPLDKIVEFLCNANVGISPHQHGSFWDLYFSTKVVEYLLIGLPVICARTRAIENYFDDSVLFFFEPGNVEDFVRQVRLIRQRADLVAAKRVAAQAKLRELNWETEKQKFLRLINQIAGLEKATVTEENLSQTGVKR